MTEWTRRCAAVIPCFNEAQRISPVVAAVRPHVGCVIVVDDGSTDGTGARAAEAGASVVSLPRNSGKGVALRQGWEAARQRGFESVLMLDGDGQHSASDIPNFFAAAENSGAKLIIGNRMGQQGRMPWLRRTVNLWMSRCLSNLTGVTLPDSQCGFRLAHLETLLQLSLHARGFVIESEMIVKYTKTRLPLGFVPVQVIYGPERSKIAPVRDTWRWMRWWAAEQKVS